MSCNCNKNFETDELMENSNILNNSDIMNTSDFLNNTMNFESCNKNNSCSCGFDDDSGFPYNAMYGHCYVPNQKMSQIFTPEQGLRKGTIFPELVSPYSPNQSINVIEYLKSRNEIGEGCNR